MAIILCVLVVSALLFTTAQTPVWRRVAWRLGWVDVPDCGRKIHRTPVARVGGIPLCLSYIAAFFVLLLFVRTGTEVREALPLAGGVLGASLIVFGTGLLDDIAGLGPWTKLAAEFVAAFVAWWCGIHVGFAQGIAWLNFPLTLVWLVGCTNALNLIDGLDGLAGGIALLAASATLAAAVLSGNTPLALAAAPLAGVLLGFLIFNFDPASIFLGDSGSLWVGFLLACFAALWSSEFDGILGMSAPFMTLAVPLFDTALAVVRRLLRSKPIFLADSGHIHHRLLRSGLTARRAVLVLYGVSALAACFALLQSVAPDRLRLPVLILFCGAAWLGTWRVAYPELRVLTRLALGADVRELVRAQLRLRAFEESVAGARTVDDCWLALRDTAREFGFSSIRLALSGQSYSEHLGNGHGGEWTLYVPLSDSEYVHLTHAFNDPAQSIVGPFTDLLYRALHNRPLRTGTYQGANPGEDGALAAATRSART